MNILILTCIPMIQQHLNDLYVASIARNHTVELWDLSSLYNRNDSVSHRVEGCRMIDSLEALDLALAKVEKPALIITNIMFYSLKRIYRVVKKHDLDIANITKEGLAYHLFESNSLSTTFKYGWQDAAKNLVRRTSVVRKLVNKLINGPVRYDYLLAANNFYTEYTRHFIRIHHIKYDEYLACKQLAPIVEGPYAVFLDTAATTHPFYRLKRHADKPKIDASQYIQLLNRLFAEIESRHHLRVVIAAHPKADYAADTFEGREIIKYQTGVLIEHASLVLSHYSTSVINAILAKKPILFLYYEDMLWNMQKYMAIGAIELGKRLNSPAQDLKGDLSISLEIDQAAYQKFIDQNILVASCATRSNADLIQDFLMDYQNRQERKPS